MERYQSEKKRRLLNRVALEFEFLNERASDDKLFDWIYSDEPERYLSLGQMNVIHFIRHSFDYTYTFNMTDSLITWDRDNRLAFAKCVAHLAESAETLK